MQQGNGAPFLLAQGVVYRPVAGGAQTVDLIRRALLQPVLRALQPVGKLRVGVGRAELAEDGFQHGNLKIHNRAQLHQQAHGYGFHGPAFNQAVVHNGLHRLGCPAGAAVVEHFVKLEILAQNAVVKAEVKGLVRLGFGVEPQNHLGLIELQQRGRREIEAGGARHFAGHALDADELVALEQRRPVAENPFGYDLAVGVGAGGGGVVLSARLKIDLLVSPAHGPVHLPAQLAVEVGGEVKGPAVPAAAGVFRRGTVVRKPGNRSEVGVALRAENADGVVAFPLLLPLGRQLLGGFVRVLGFEGIQNVENLPALAQCLQDILCVGARAVELCLVAAVHLNAELLHGVQKFLLKMRGKALVAAPGVGDVHIGAADIFVVAVPHNLPDIRGNFAAAVKLVKGEQQPGLFAHFAQCPDHKQWGGHIPEIADVNRPGGADARGTDVFFLIRAALDDALRDFFRPMHVFILFFIQIRNCPYILPYFAPFVNRGAKEICTGFVRFVTLTAFAGKKETRAACFSYKLTIVFDSDL